MRHEESMIQRNCIMWFNLQHRDIARCLFAVPNGARTSSTQAKILKAEGMRSGVADVILLVPSKGFHGLMIEFKTEKGRQSETQKAFQKAVEEQGYKYIIVRSFDEFRRRVTNYLNRNYEGEI